MSIIKKYEKGENISMKNGYRVIEYRDEKGKVRLASTLGRKKHHTIVYVEDNIRLCTIQRSNLDHL